MLRKKHIFTKFWITFTVVCAMSVNVVTYPIKASVVDRKITLSETTRQTMNCPDCNAFAYLKCINDKIYAYTTMCKYNSSCRVSVYTSTCANICSECRNYIMLYGEHECYEVHNLCGRGKVKIYHVSHN